MKNLYNSNSFKDRFKFLVKNQFWSKQKIDSYQLTELRKLVSYVWKNIPFYKKFMRENNIKPSMIKNVSDLKLFPLIDKKIIQENYKEFMPIIKKKKIYNRTTGGSTGTPLTVYYDFEFLTKDKANTNYYMNVFGLDIFNYKSIRIYGDYLDNNLIKKNIFWKKENKKLIMSCYHINKKNLMFYVEEFNKFKPVYIHTRPSSILTFAKLIIEYKATIKNNVKYIFCDGEYLTLGQRKIIEKAFRTRVINIYGHTEGCTFAHPCVESNDLHFVPNVGILKLLKKKKKECTKNNEKGELVVTGFNNKILPLIRYRTGDIAINSTSQCKCKRNFRMIKEIEGRKQDYVVNSNKEVIPLAPAIFNYNDMNWKGIQEFKVIQNRIGKLNFLMQLDKNLKVNLNTINQKLSKILGDFSIKITIVKKLDKTKIGKFRYLEQNLKILKYFS